MKRAIIIDDEENSRETLASFVGKYCPDLQVIAQADGVATGIEAIRTHKPDMIFLDIEMDDGLGFDILKSVPDMRFDVIFVTAYNQYATLAFRYSAVDYLLKPINPEELIQAVHKLSDNGRIDAIEMKLEALFANKTTLNKIAFPSMNGVRLEDTKNILYCESDNSYTVVHLINKEQLIVSKTLKDYDELLSENGFFRIHQKYLVNLNFIANYTKSDGGFVTLTNGKNLTVSRRRKDELISIIS